MAPFLDTQWFIPTSVFVGGLLGSPHCVGMCGPLVVNFAANRSRLLAYQVSRAFSYALVGALAGAFGGRLLGPERPSWLSAASLSVIAALLLINGYRAFFSSSLHWPIPRFMQRWSQSLWHAKRLQSAPPLAMASVAGFLTVFLPCGHLYSFLLGAIATGSALKGFLFMLAFALGSAPLLSLSGLGLNKLMQIPGGQRQRWGGVLIVAAGLFGLISFGAQAEKFLNHRHAHSGVENHEEHAGHCHETTNGK